MGIHNYDRIFERVIERVGEIKEISDTNKDAILRFKDYLLSEGIGKARINRYIEDLFKFNKLLGKDFEDADKGDIRRVVSEINQTSLSEETKRSFKIMLRKFYVFLRGAERGAYPDEVRWMKMSIGVSHKKLPEELLNENEVKRIVQACTNIRDKALIACLAESGGRVGEIGLMKIKHVSFETYGARLSLSGKTGARKILIINSAPFLHEWINSHPDNYNPDAFLWYGRYPDSPLNYARIAAILKRAAKKAGIRKRIHPHLLRHSRATQLASIMSDSQLKNYLGWTQGSKMAGIYVHMSGRDADDAILQANNIQIDKIRKDPALKPIQCGRCKTINPVTNKFCSVCGFVLDDEEAQEILTKENNQKTANDVMELLFKDEEVVEFISRKMDQIKNEIK